MKRLIMPIALVAGLGTAAVVGVAAASSFTLKVATNAKVIDGQNNTLVGHENIAVSSHGKALYALSGDSKSHPKCHTATCFQFWPPLMVSSPSALSKASGIHGTLGTWQRDGFFQVTLNGHPLYRFSPDTHKDVAKGDLIVSFGGTWHVVKAGGPSAGASTMSTPTTPTTTPYTPPPTTTTPPPTTTTPPPCTTSYCY